MIRFDRVGKTYPGGIVALADLSFEIVAGQMVVLAGRSGAGKSTLLRMIPAIERPTIGRVLVGGQDVGSLKRAAIPYLRRNLGLVFQDQKLLLDRSTIDNVMLPLAIIGLPAREAERRAAAALEKVGLAGRAKAPPAALSGGEQQRLAIARAIVNRPSLLLADEPTANLDAEYAHDIAALLDSFCRSGVTVLVATHDESVFSTFGPRRLHLEHGKLVA